MKRSTAPVKGKGSGNSSSIFRKTHTSSSVARIPPVEPALTFTLSQDETITNVASESTIRETKSPQIQGEKTASYVFTEDQMIAHGVNQIKMIAEKEAEISKIRRENVELTHRLKLKEEELELVGSDLNHTKDELERVRDDFTRRLEQTKDELKKTREELFDKDNELTETYHELSDKDDELTETKIELYNTKSELRKVSSVLMQTQHELIELTEKSTSTAYFWSW